MVEFKIRTDPEKVASLDAHNPDLYGHPVSTDEVIEVGGLNTPQKALFRFKLAETPRYGAGELKKAEFVFKANNLVSDYDNDFNVEVPTLNFYKVKDDAGLGAMDWGGEGDISVVTKKIHQISGDNGDFPSIIENFSGDPYRESDLGFEPISRTSWLISDRPYQDMQTLTSALANDYWEVDKEGTATTHGADTFFADFGTNDPQLGKVIFLQSHSTTSGGGGWWRTKTSSHQTGATGEEKYLNKSRKDHILWGEKHVTQKDLYGDEITPENSIFHTVRGDTEYMGTDAGAEESGEEVVIANGAVRFSTKKKISGSQSMNMMTYWRSGNSQIHHEEVDTHAGYTTTPDHVQTCMVAYNNLPYPEPIVPATVNSLPVGANDATTDTYDDADPSFYPKLSMKINFEKLEKAFSYQSDEDQDGHTHFRGVFIIFSNVAPDKGETWSNYTNRATGINGVNGSEILDITGPETYAGVFIRNSDMGIRLSDVTKMKFISSGDKWYNYSYNQSYGATHTDGYDKNADGVSASYNFNRTNMVEDQWYTFDFLFTPTDDYMYLNIADQAGEPVHDMYRSNYKKGLKALNIAGMNAAGSRTDMAIVGGPRHDQWPCHMSIWVNNTAHQYVATTNKGTDWMIDNSGTLHDALTSIYIDSIEYTGINLNHNNATNVTSNKNKGRLVMAGGKTATGHPDGASGGQPSYLENFTDYKYNADFIMAFGCDNITDWGASDGAATADDEHRYLLFQDFQHVNNQLPGPLGSPDAQAPIGYDARSVFSVGHSKHDDPYGRGGASLKSVYIQDLTRTTLATDIATGTHQGHLSSFSAGKENTTAEWKTAQFSLYASGESDYDNSEDELDTDGTKGKQFMVNGFIKKGFARLRLDTTAVISGHFLPTATHVDTGLETIKFNDECIGGAGGQTDFGFMAYGEASDDWISGMASGDAVHLSSFSSTEGSDGDLPGGISRGTKYYAQNYSNTAGKAQFKLSADVGGEFSTNITSNSGSANHNAVVHGGSGVAHQKIECIFSSAKVLEVISPIGNSTAWSRQDVTLRVDTTTPLISYADTTYMLYIRDEGRYSPRTDSNQKYAVTGKNITIVDATTIIVHDWTGNGNSAVAFLCGNGSTTEIRPITRLWISPEKYWIWMVGHMQGNTGDDYDDEDFVDSASDSGIFNGRTRSYSGITLCKQYTDASSTARSGAGVLGATYNEFMINFKDQGNLQAPYVNKWTHEVLEDTADNASTILDLQDFGFGAAKADEGGTIRGGHVGSCRVELNTVTTAILPNITTVSNMKPGDSLDLLAQQPHYDNIPKTMQMVSNNTDYDIKPHLLTVFEDTLPIITEFKVQPNEENPRYTDFTWTCDEEDLWYGFIILDTKPISHQYHNSSFHVPLNEDLSVGHDTADPIYGLKSTDLSGSTDSRQNRIMGYRYYETNPVTLDSLQSVFGGGTYGKMLKPDTSGYANSETGAIASKQQNIYDWNTGLAGHTKRFRKEDADGGDILTNGTFTGNANDWLIYGAAGWSYSSNKIAYNDSTDNARLTQDDLTIEKYNWYQLSFDISDATASMRISGGYGAGNDDDYWIEDPTEAVHLKGDGLTIGTGSFARVLPKGSFNIADGKPSSASSFGAAGGFGTGGRHNVFFMPNTTWDRIRFHAYIGSSGAFKMDNVSLRKVSNGTAVSWPTYGFGTISSHETTVTRDYNSYAIPLEQMSVVAHVTPLSWGTSSTNPNWVMATSNVYENDPDATDNLYWGIYIDDNGYVNVVQQMEEQVAFIGAYTRSLKSKKQVPTDGTPVNIIYTIDTELSYGNMKLFIDGILEDQSGHIVTTDLDLTGWRRSTGSIERVNAFQVGVNLPTLNNTNGLQYQFTIGAQSYNNFTYASNIWDDLTDNETRTGGFDGYIEEVVLYNKIIYPVNPKDGLFTLTKPLPELHFGKEWAQPLTWNAKLFVKDYHNIRGKGPKDVAQTSNISWARTAFPISTGGEYTEI